MEPISLSIVMDDILDFLLQLPNLKTIDILGENLMKFGLVTNGKSFSALKSIETLSIYGELDESFIEVLPENLYELNVNDLPMSSIAIPLAKWIEKSHNLNRFTVSNMETLQDDSWSVVLLNSLQTRTNLISLSIPCDSTPTETSLNLTKNVIENNRHLQSLTISSDLDRIDSISSLTSSIVQLQSLHTLQLDISSLGLQDICDILERSKSLRNLLLDFNSDLAAEAEDLNTDAYLSRLINSLKLNSTLTKFDCTGEVFSFGEGELDAKKLPVVLTNNPLLHMTFEAFESRINLKAATSEIELINLDAARLLRISRLLLTFTTFLHPVTIIHILDYLLVRFPLDRKLLLSVLTNRKSIGCMSFGEVFNCQVLIRNCLSFQNKAR
ncbi:hypothetical protein BC833DRAFT_613401 [Globomyces pollinis-pini]|nr:hypothetical protein BC833DRAFT_613401 [Globomyces pollinis-pini]